MVAGRLSALRGTRPGGAAARRSKPPLEHSLLYTATLCLLAGGAVMVYSASSAESLLGGSGDPSHYLKRYLLFGLLGLAILQLMSRVGLGVVRALTPVLLAVSFGLTLAVMLPGLGVSVNGATRWIEAGPVQFQPSELLKFAVVLYAVQLLALRPSALRTLGGICKPLLVVVGAACVLVLVQPDMGTAIVICAAVGALLVTAGAKLRHVALIGVALSAIAVLVILIEPYRRARMIAFVDPWSDASGAGFQVVQSMIAMGSGGVFGVGLGESVQKIFYLPEAHTDMILAIVGEEVGLIGVLVIITLYGMIGYAGLRAAKLARDRYSKLLAAGVTSLIMCQATLNLFAVMGMAPLTGVPLPFMSYGMTNLIVLLAGMGLVLNVASSRVGARKPRLRVVQEAERARSRDRGGRHRGARGSRTGRRRRAAG